MNTVHAATLLAASLVLAVPARGALPEGQAQTRPAAPEAPRPVDLVICLDTSGSMAQLIDSVRGKIWDIVTDLSFLRPTPHLRVGLLTYGTPSTATAEEGWVVRQIDLTDDLDSVYAALMALWTEGGDEYVGWVLRDAVHTMSWSDDPAGMRIIFVAGNETADLGVEMADFRDAALEARNNDIVIHSIYAGDPARGEQELWADVADHGGGIYSAIDMALGTLQIPTPYDGSLLLLNDELNATYLPYGEKGAEGLANQCTQDANALRVGTQSCGSRIAAKGCGLYNNASWDLVDAVDTKGFSLTDLKREDLPEAIRSLGPDARKKYVAAMRRIRKGVQAKIQDTNASRQEYIRAEFKRLNPAGTSLDQAMLEGLRSQAKTKGFTFVEKPSGKGGSLEGIIPAFRPGPRISGNLAALVAAMPAVEYRVGSYGTRHEAFASILAKEVSEVVTYLVGERTFPGRKEAQAQVIERLRIEVDALTKIEEVHGSNTGFPYAKPNPAESGAPAGGPYYRVGGFQFDNKAMAETAWKRIRAALNRLEGGHSRKSTIGDAAIAKDAATAGGTDEEIQRSLEYLTRKVRIIGEAAAKAYIAQIKNC